MRVADFNGARASDESTSTKGNSAKANQTDGNVSMPEGKVDQAKHDIEHQTPLDSELDGVLYCALDKTNGVSTNSGVAEVNNIMIEEP